MIRHIRQSRYAQLPQYVHLRRLDSDLFERFARRTAGRAVDRQQLGALTLAEQAEVDVAASLRVLQSTGILIVDDVARSRIEGRVSGRVDSTYYRPRGEFLFRCRWAARVRRRRRSRTAVGATAAGRPRR